MQEATVKYFTPKEANRTLPLVKKIIRDILLDVNRIRSFSKDKNLEINSEEKIEHLRIRIEGYIKELEEIGCSYKDWSFEFGLIDFPAIIDGKEVLLCWRSDEDTILFYHGYDEGYAVRKKIPTEYL